MIGSLPSCNSSGSLTISLYTPGNGATLTSAPVTLAVSYSNSSDSSIVVGVFTQFYIRMPGTGTFDEVGEAMAGTDGHASLTYNPPFAGLYQWYVMGYGSENRTSDTWSFTCATPSVTTTLWSRQTATQTVGVVTEYSYLYATLTRITTAYRTATFTTTSTTRSYSTATATTSRFATTQTLPITVNETVSAITTEHSSGTVTLTQYVYVETYIQPSEEEVIPFISGGSTGSVIFQKSDQHSVQEIFIQTNKAISNLTLNVRVTSSQPPTGTTDADYKYLEITAAKLTNAEIGGVRIRFKVDKQWLRDNSVEPNKVTLYRQKDGVWTGLETSLLNTDDFFAYYEAVSPGFSLFAIAGEPSSNVYVPHLGTLSHESLLLLVVAPLVVAGSFAAIRIVRRKRGTPNTDGKENDGPASDKDDVVEKKLYDYIVAHGGSISVTKAAQELNVPIDEVARNLDSLKTNGKLKAM
jgi:PGF-pre-PGF domain-containing protein